MGGVLPALVNMDGDEAMVELRLKPQLHGVLMRPQCQRNLVWEQTNAGAVVEIRRWWYLSGIVASAQLAALTQHRHATQRINLVAALGHMRLLAAIPPLFAARDPDPHWTDHLVQFRNL